MVDAALGTSGTALISHEIFATADAEHAKAAMGSFGAAELHLVVTARDPERQIVSSFQQRIKNGHDHTFKHAVENVVEREGLHHSQRLPELIERWGARCPPSASIVTVPQSGAEPHLLWDRFAQVIGFDASDCPPISGSTNASLGPVETELLRRVNVAPATGFPTPAMPRSCFASTPSRCSRVPLSRVGSRSIRRCRPLADRIADEWITAIAAGGYDVAGDLESSDHPTVTGETRTPRRPTSSRRQRSARTPSFCSC